MEAVVGPMGAFVGLMGAFLDSMGAVVGLMSAFLGLMRAAVGSFFVGIIGAGGWMNNANSQVHERRPRRQQ
jgi:hypothetical protein